MCTNNVLFYDGVPRKSYKIFVLGHSENIKNHWRTHQPVCCGYSMKS